MKDIESYRDKVFTDLFASKTAKAAWPIWEPALLSKSANFSDPKKVLSIGSDLATIFKSTGTAGRGQGTLSAAGHAWETLVCWYLNVVLSGSRAIAIKQKKALVPECVSDSATISYGVDQTNTESDLIVIVFPDGFSFPGGGIADLSNAMENQLSKFELGIIQCKTNWNDNAQIPMLWDMVYRAKGFQGHNVTIGRNHHTIGDYRRFTYAFVTVPSQSGGYSPQDMSVKRVRNLSGGNYWGHPTQNGVAFSLSEIFARNFGSAFNQPIPQQLAAAISTKTGWFSRY
ncbi:hypothetical protein [Erythrobacter sp.]|uniref:hypothetical protein n=1 Tax=Erythrobacter sp. TaxID=1042 RepID=UPI001425D552|nr:hypothetical protein [Erythrobacter sp.]QIQ87956.1 MAG: hypothetical protein G9473_15580 [Erythrobacter sp.]